MTRPILGVTHQLLCPDAWTDAEAHERTLCEIMLDLPVEAIDLLGPPDGNPARIAREAAAVRSSGKQVHFCLPFLHAEPGSDPSHPDAAHRARALETATAGLAVAHAFGATRVVTVSGADLGPERRAAHTAGYVEFLTALCAAAAPLPLVIEPMDREIDKRALIGPTAEAAALVRRVHAAGPTNLGLLVDMSHLPLLGEGFDQALDVAGELTHHVHLGNCLLSDRGDPLYGDKHPPLGYPGSEHDASHLREFVAALRRSGYLARDGATVSFEVRPRAGLTERETIEQHLAWFEEAWAAP